MLSAGHSLVLADVPTTRMDEIKERVRQHPFEVEVVSTELKLPAFLKSNHCEHYPILKIPRNLRIKVAKLLLHYER